MKVALNGWQRLWVVFSALTLACVLALLTLIWPHRDLDVLSDIASPKCKPFLEVPAGFFAEQPPERNEACYSLQSLSFWDKVNISGVSDYDSYMLHKRVRFSVTTIAAWLGVTLLIYVIGWSVAWVRRGFSGAAKAQQGAPADVPASRERG